MIYYYRRVNTVASTAVMIKPMSFCANPDTVDSNSFQTGREGEKSEVLKKSQSEFAVFQQKLIEHGIRILKFDESPTKHTPDALFPNNWFCHLPDGRVFLFPMYPKNRRDEYREDVISSLHAKEIIDLRYLEKENIFLEGTGSLILDHGNKAGFACLSPRTSAKGLAVFSALSGYQITAFDSMDLNGQPIYHTNVMMALSPKHAVMNMSSIKNPAQKELLKNQIKNSGRTLIDISYEEMNSFAGNMLFLKNHWICSTKAYNALSEPHRKALEAEAPFIHSDLDTIETYGGGGARCLLAEVF